MEETMTKEEIVKQAIKNNPELAADLAENSIGTAKDGTKVYPSLDAARKELGLVSITSDHETKVYDTKNMRFLSSGVIEDKRFKMTEAKSDKFIINFAGSLTEGIDMIHIPTQPGVVSVGKINCDEEIEILRVLYIHRFEKDNKLETVFHVSSENMTSIGKSHKLYLGDTFTTLDDRNEDARNAENGIITAPHVFQDLKSIVDINTETGDIRVACIKDEDAVDTDIMERLGKDEWFVLPIVVKKSTMDSISESTEKLFKEHYDEIIECFVENNLTEDKHTAIKNFIDSIIGGNSNLDKYTLIDAFNSGKLKPIKNQFEESSGEVDELAVVSMIYPRFGAENIDWNNVPLNEEGNVILTKKDIANIKIFGIPEQVIENILNTAAETIKSAKDSINVSKSTLEDLKTEIYDAKCKLSLDIDGKDWYKSVCENFKVIQEETSLNANIAGSEEFVKSSKNQIAGFKVLSNRIQKKIEHGEFSNTYMLTCANVFNKVWKNAVCKNDEDEEIVENLYTKFIEYINSFYTTHTAKDFIGDKFKEMATNSLFIQNLGKKNSYGKEDLSIAAKYDDYSKLLVSLAGIDDMEPEQGSEEIINRVTARYEFMKALSTAPIQFLCRVYPEIAAAINCEKEVSENRKSIAKAMREELGLNECVDSEKMRKKVDFLVSEINSIHDYVTGDIRTAAKAALVNADEFAKRIGSKTVKGNGKKLSAYARSIVVIDSVKYLEPIATGRMIRDIKANPLKEGEGIATNATPSAVTFENVINGKQISREEYDKLNDAEKIAYAVYDEIGGLEIDRLYTDYLIRTSLNSLIFNVLGRMTSDFEDCCENVKAKYADDMFASLLSLFIPSVSIIETTNISKLEGEFNAMNLIDGGTKAKLGTTAVKNSIGTMNTTDDLKEQRTRYIEAALDFVSLIFKIGSTKEDDSNVTESAE